jgi:NitT/TauT family transport system substrate-binding protein
VSWTARLVSLVTCSLAIPAAGAAPTARRPIHVAYPSAADLGDLPSLMVEAQLTREGYDVRTTFYARAQLAVEAVARGHADVGMGSTRTYWAAIARGADVVTVMEQVANGWSLVARPEITTCAGLHGKRLALSSEGSLSAALSLAYVRRSCPGTEPRIVIIAGSENRAAALLAGAVDASPVELAEAVRLGRKAPGRIHTLVDFAATQPGLKTTGVHVNRAWAEKNPAAVEAYMGALLEVHRRARSDAAGLTAEARRRLAIDGPVVAAHLAAGVWDVNGGLTTKAVADTLEFFIAAGSLPRGLTPQRVADLGPLERVLAGLGRR